MTSSQIGLEVDGDRVTLVEVNNGVAVSSRTVTHHSLSSAITLALSGYKMRRNDPPLRVVLAANGINLRRIDVTSALLSRQGFENAAFDALPVPRETNTAAGIFFDPARINGDIVTPGIAVVAPTIQVDKVYEALGRRESEVVVPPSVLSGLDGVWLAIRYSTADVTLVSGGRPVAYRQLRCGGLSSVAGLLGDELSNMARLNAVLNRQGMGDQIAEAELARYLQNLSLELRQTCDYWKRSGEDISGPVAVYGVGAGAPGLPEALTHQQFELGMHPEIERRLVYLPAGERANAVGAFLAAMSCGADMPQVAFVNPYAIALEQDNRRRDRRARRLLGAMLTVGFIGLVAGIPYASTSLDLRDARAGLSEARIEFQNGAAGFQKLSDTQTRLDLATEIRAGEPAWPSIMSVTFATMPVGSKIRSLSATVVDGSLKVRATAQLDGGSYADLTDWLDKLRATTNVEAAWSESFTNKEGRAVFDLTFTVRPSQETVAAVGTEDTGATPSADQPAGEETR